MSLHFEKIPVKKIQEETNECVTITLDIPGSLKPAFAFTHGQHLNFRSIINGEELRRTYSLCTAPYEKEWKVAVKKTYNGRFSTFVNEQLKVGDILEVMPPSGTFSTPIDPAQRKNYVAFAAGSGITPIISILKTILQEEPLSTFTLVFGNKTRQSIIFFEELEGLKNKYLNRFQLIFLLSREKTESPINDGRISFEKLKSLEKLIQYNRVHEYFICGPETMLFCVKEFLQSIGVAEKKIHFELFTTPGENIVQTLPIKKPEAIGASSSISVKIDGRFTQFEMAEDDPHSILDAALHAGADLPFSCKGGVCCTCKAKLLEGEVDMKVHYGLEDEEIEEGFILTCQSRPLTKNVVVDFDIK
ncbi:MAG: 2Fe-2S iron-sulfur cluster binding domain-containing protein [Bacteroidetes bacterium]|nr:2Fe-2S iron-sulfur cluster binding domain-containing protein [Bacteroidota bacterium]